MGSTRLRVVRARAGGPTRRWLRGFPRVARKLPIARRSHGLARLWALEPSAFKAVEDSGVRKVVALQEEAGCQIVTDGPGGLRAERPMIVEVRGEAVAFQESSLLIPDVGRVHVL